MTSVIRLKKELESLENNPIENISTGPLHDNLHTWEACIFGPMETPYQGGVFKLRLTFPSEYPFEKPKIKFTTPIFHPNINRKGEICLDILKNRWTPSLTIRTILLSICSLLNDPNPDDPLVPEIANVYKKDINRYNTIAKNWTATYANN